MSATPASNRVARLRNLGIVAHINAGKTTLSERILFLTGKQRFFGTVDEGTATMDFLREEQERGISITAAVTNVRWKGHELNLIDTPGHVDFTAEVQRSLRVLDGVVVVLDGVRGVESQTELVWRQVLAAKVPRLVFVNKMDRPVADFLRAAESVRERLRARVAVVVIPLVHEQRLVGLVDVIRGTVTDCGGVRQVDAGAANAEARAALVELLADFDEAILADFVAGTPIEAPRLDRALRGACLSGAVVPMLAGAALENFGVDLLLDAVCRYLPSPADHAPIVSLDDPDQRRPPEPEAPFCGLCFKVQADPESGALAHFVRIYSGVLSSGVTVGSTHAPLQVGELWRIHAGEREAVVSAGPGEVVAFAGAETLVTGDTLWATGHPMRLEPVRFPEPVIVTSLEPELAGDLAKVEAAAALLQREDPTLEVERDPATGAFVVRGMGELHLEVFAERLQRVAKCGVRVGRPQVAMWETISRTVGAAAECRRTTSLGEAWARVEIALVPKPHLGSAMVEDLAGPAAVGLQLRDRVALLEEMGALLRHGLRQPFPARDLVFQLVSCSAVATEQESGVLLLDALHVATRKAVGSAAAFLLEPVMEIEVESPGSALSAVLADLGSRGAWIQGVNSGFETATVHGLARLSALLGYATRLRSLSKGLATATLTTRGLARAGEGGETPATPSEKELRSLDRRELPR